MISSLFKAYKIFRRLHLVILIGSVAIISMLATAITLKAFIETPEFMFDIKDQMLANKDFQDKIGQSNGYTIWFDKEKIEVSDTIHFSVSIDGKHDSAFVKITGKYHYDDEGRTLYYKQDTLYKGL